MDEVRVNLYSLENLKRRLWWLVIQRLLAAIALLLSIGWTRGWQSAVFAGGWRIFLGVGALSLIYMLALHYGPALRWQARVQTIGDVLLTTLLVWFTMHWEGGNISPYTPLYVIVIASSSLVLGARAAILTALASAVALTTLGLAGNLGWAVWDASLASAVPPVKSMTAIGWYDIAFLAVGLVAARMAERQDRSQERLEMATQSLANLRALHERIVESIRSGVVTTDLSGRIYTFNNAAQSITGYKIADVRGQEIAALFGPLGQRLADVLPQVAQGHVTPTLEDECPTSDGGRVMLSLNLSPLADENGKITGLVLTFHDLTELRTLEETARRQDRLAAVGRMAAAIAHEIRNPLAAVRGSVQVLAADLPKDSQPQELIQIVVRESDRINRIVSDYLTYARPRTSTPTSIDLCELLENLLQDFRQSPNVQDHHFIITEFPHFPMLLEGDAEQLRQAFYNVALNGVQAMPDGGTLRVEVHNSSPYRRRIVFSDNGQGMPPEQVEQLFEPFTSTNGGTGLGLSIVYQTIREHGGTINVHSRERHGTTITIELPMRSNR